MNIRIEGNPTNEKKADTVSKDNVKSSENEKKTKPEISNSFLQRIISLLKKEELI